MSFIWHDSNRGEGIQKSHTWVNTLRLEPSKLLNQTVSNHTNDIISVYLSIQYGSCCVINIISHPSRLLLSILLHTLLDPVLGSLGLLLKFLLRLLELIKRSVRRGHVATLLESRTLEELVQPLLKMGEIGDINAGPFWIGFYQH